MITAPYIRSSGLSGIFFWMTISIFTMVIKGCNQPTFSDEICMTRQYIKANWKNTLEFNPRDTGTLIGLPFPYNVPTMSGEKMFREMYYWDTYFTNVGLLLDGQIQLAKNNTENILYLIRRFGNMPNGSRTYYLNRSQPPFASMMVGDVYEATGDLEWLNNAIPALEKEYQFWITERTGPEGLNHYSSSADSIQRIKMAEYLKVRFSNDEMIDTLTVEEKLVWGRHYTAEAESGWDFTPRFQGRCEDHYPVDLNSYLFLWEKNFAYFARENGNEVRAREWEEIASNRQKLIEKLLQDSITGLFLDYDFVNKKHSPVPSAASFTTLFAGLVSQEEAFTIVKKLLPLLETDYGIRTCAYIGKENNYQWGNINAWAPLHLMTIQGLLNYSFDKEARRISSKYLKLVAGHYKKSGKIWEKYNAIDGSTQTVNEYEMPAFLGWTAGVFNYCMSILEE